MTVYSFIIILIIVGLTSLITGGDSNACNLCWKKYYIHHIWTEPNSKSTKLLLPHLQNWGSVDISIIPFIFKGLNLDFAFYCVYFRLSILNILTARKLHVYAIYKPKKNLFPTLKCMFFFSVLGKAKPPPMKNSPK